MKSQNYRRSRNLYDPKSKEPFRISRSRLEKFFNCPRCFYLDRCLGIEPPSMPSFTLNTAVDALLKKEFDVYRQESKVHPIMESFGVQAVPYAHEKLDIWRENFKGVEYHHKPTNLIITGAVDDLWVNKESEIHVVEYKSTSTERNISLDGKYKEAYKRQIEIYQWLLRRQGLEISNIGFFVYCNADKSKAGFKGKLEFRMEIIAYQGDDSWVESVIKQAHKCLSSETLPPFSSECEYCQYRQISQRLEKGQSHEKPVQQILF